MTTKPFQHTPVGEVLSSGEYHDPADSGHTHTLGDSQAVGDMIIADTGVGGQNTLVGLAVGTAGQVLMSDGTRPTWSPQLFNIDIKLADGQTLKFGNDDDVSLHFDNTTGKLVVSGINVETLANVRDVAATEGQALIYDDTNDDWRPVTLHNIVLNPNAGHIATDDIDDEAVTTDKIDDNAVTTDKIANLAVTTAKIDNTAITTEKIADYAVGSQEIATGAITEDKLAQDVGFNLTVDVDGFTGLDRLLDGQLDVIEAAPTQTDFTRYYRFRDFEIGDLPDSQAVFYIVDRDGFEEIDYDDIPVRTVRLTAQPQPSDWVTPTQYTWKHAYNINRYNPFTTNFDRTAADGRLIAKGTYHQRSGTAFREGNSMKGRALIRHWQLRVYRIDRKLYGAIDAWVAPTLEFTIDTLSSGSETPTGNDAYPYVLGAEAIAAGLADSYEQLDRVQFPDRGLSISSVPGWLATLTLTANQVGILMTDNIDPAIVTDDAIPATGGSTTEAPSVRAVRAGLDAVQASYLRERTAVSASTSLSLIPKAVTLSSDIEAGTMLVFRLNHHVATNVEYDYAFMLPADEIISLARFGTTPTTTAGLNGNLDDGLMLGEPTSSTDNLVIWRHDDDDKLWLRVGEAGTYHVQIFKYQLGLNPNPGSGGGGGVDENAVKALIADWAETTNTSLIPAGKLANIISNATIPPEETASATVAASQLQTRTAIDVVAVEAADATTAARTAAVNQANQYTDTAVAGISVPTISNADIPVNVADASTTAGTTPRAVRQMLIDSIETGDGAVSSAIEMLASTDITSTATAYTLQHDLEDNQFLWITGSSDTNTDYGNTELATLPAAAIRRLTQQSTTPDANDPHIDIEKYAGQREQLRLWRHSDANKIWIQHYTGTEFDHIAIYAVEIHAHAEEGGLGDATQSVVSQSLTGTNSGAATRVNLSKSLLHGQLLTFCYNPTASGFSDCHIQTIISDDLLRLTPQTSAPTNIANAVSFPYAEAEDIYIWRGAQADHIYVRVDQTGTLDVFTYDIRAIVQASTGLNQSEVDARVRHGVADWAEYDNTGAIPASKLTNAPPSGLNQSQVDARVQAGVLDWAETGNTDTIPTAKIPSGVGLTQAQVDARVQAGVEDWAEQGNSTAIPAAKLTNAPSSGGLTQQQVDNRIADRVQDWAETANTDVIPFNKLTSIVYNDVRAGTNASSDLAPSEAAVRSELDAINTAVGTQGGIGERITLAINQTPSTTTYEEITLSQALTNDMMVVFNIRNESNDVDTENDPPQYQRLYQSFLAREYFQMAAFATDPGTNGYARKDNLILLTYNNQGLSGNTYRHLRIARHTDPLKMWIYCGDSEGDYMDIYAYKIIARGPQGERGPAGADGLTQTQVDARVTAGVEDWAEAGNTSLIPASKLTNAPGGALDTTAVNALIDTRVENWAETTNPSDTIPDAKLTIVSNDDLDASVTAASTTKAPSERAVRQAIDAVELEYGEGLSGLHPKDYVLNRWTTINTGGSFSGSGTNWTEVTLSRPLENNELLRFGVYYHYNPDVFNDTGIVVNIITLSNNILTLGDRYGTRPSGTGILHFGRVHNYVTQVTATLIPLEYAGTAHAAKNIAIARHVDDDKLWITTDEDSSEYIYIETLGVRFGGGDAKIGSAIGVLNKTGADTGETITHTTDANLAARWRLMTLDAPIPTDTPHIISAQGWQTEDEEAHPTMFLSNEFLARPAIGHDPVIPTSTTLHDNSFVLFGSHDHDHIMLITRHTDPTKLWVGGEGTAHLADDIQINAYPIEGGSILVSDDGLTNVSESNASRTKGASQRAVVHLVNDTKSSSLMHKDQLFSKTSTNPATEVHGSATVTLTDPLFDYNLSHYKQIAIWWQWSSYMGYTIIPYEALDTQDAAQVEHWGRLYVHANRDDGKHISFYRNSANKLVWTSYHGLDNNHWLHIKAWGYR